MGALVQLYVADAVGHELKLGIKGSEKPECRLSSQSGEVRLGVDTWLWSREPQQSWERFPALPRMDRDGVREKAA
jgi:predicted component of type VI protein secretion system